MRSVWLLIFVASMPPASLGGEPSTGVRTLEGHTGSVMAIAFTPDGRTFATSSRDKNIKLWDARSGKLQRTLSEHTADVYAVRFSSNGDWLVSGSGDKTVKLWDARTWKVLRTFHGHTDIVRAVAFARRKDARLRECGPDDPSLGPGDRRYETRTHGT